MVVTLKDTVDHIVTEHGVTEMPGRSTRNEQRALIEDRRPVVP